LATYANDVDVRTVLDHPLLELNKLLVEEMATLADLGTYVGVYCQPMIPSLYQPVQDPMETVEVIRRIGADRCVAASDFGQVLHIDAIDGVRVYIRALRGFGIPNEDIRTMLCDNPARLLGLDEA
jgi:predicted metal-dependent TIM-barrel fold hydrolase